VMTRGREEDLERRSSEVRRNRCTRVGGHQAARGSPPAVNFVPELPLGDEDPMGRPPGLPVKMPTAEGVSRWWRCPTAARSTCSE
jgi:hypothetical protein